MNPKNASEEDLKNGFYNGTLEELDAVAKRVTGYGLDSPPVNVAIEDRKRHQPILKTCQKCALPCKKHKAPGLISFKCLDAVKEKR